MTSETVELAGVDERLSLFRHPKRAVKLGGMWGTGFGFLPSIAIKAESKSCILLEMSTAESRKANMRVFSLKFASDRIK